MKRVVYSLLMIAAAVAFTALYALILYGLAGRRDLPFIHAYVVAVGLLTLVGLLATDPGLMRERIRPGEGGRDSMLIPVGKSLLTLHLVIAPLDVGRFHWSPPMPAWLQVLGLAGFVAGLGFAIWAMAVNRFFSSVVRLQSDRGHTLIDTGPYALVRHPGYSGIILGTMASGLALGSSWSIVPVVLFNLLILRRLAIEDRFLHEHLEGYPEYAARVRFRLIPGVW